jgi:phage-related protein (TIGR01555 family)
MHHLNDAVRWSRLYGGAVLVVGAMDSGALDVQLNPDGIRDVEFIRVYDRYQATVQTRVSDPTVTDYGQPELWLISPMLAGTQPYHVHNSRVIVFDGEALPDRLRSANNGWGMSTLQSCYSQLLRLGESYQWASALLERSQQAVHSIKNLADILSLPGGEENVKRRMDLVDMVRGILNTIVIDGDGETYEVKTLSVAGVTDLLDRFAEAASAVSRIPVYKFMERSMGGLNSTGNAERESWQATIGSMQNDILRKPLHSLVGMICSSMGIAEEFKIEFNPLSVPTKKECAEIEKLEADAGRVRAETDVAYVTINVVDPAELRKSGRIMGLYQIDTGLDITPTAHEMDE